MAEDAAGVVRRTPRPAWVPALWWSPTECAVYVDREGAALRYIQMRDTKRNLPLPADAVQLVGPDQRRPVVLLRAEDCACPTGGDCPHGPEPVDALDLAVWLHAEQQQELDAMGAAVVAHAEVIDGLQARIDAALKLHTEYSIYADCGHADHDDDEDVVDLGDKFVCAEGYQYSVCLACCCDGTDGGQTEVCAEQHCPDEKPNLCWPCPTRRALKDLAEPESDRG